MGKTKLLVQYQRIHGLNYLYMILIILCQYLVDEFQLEIKMAKSKIWYGLDDNGNKLANGIYTYDKIN